MLTGQPDAIDAHLAQARGKAGRLHARAHEEFDRLRTRLSIVPASQVVLMDEAPAQALRGKRDSSMRVAIQQLKKGDSPAHACVSAGNTGALMAISRFVLKMQEGIDRPAIAGQLPNQLGGATTMLDLGANVDCTPQNLVQFAVMGSALVNVLEGKERPTIGLLNIGEEAIKGRRHHVRPAVPHVRQPARAGEGDRAQPASLTATFGAMVWIFQDGHLSGLLDFTATGNSTSTTPILMFCIAFGLSMDYEVFLLVPHQGGARPHRRQHAIGGRRAWSAPAASSPPPPLLLAVDVRRLRHVAASRSSSCSASAWRWRS